MKKLLYVIVGLIVGLTIGYYCFRVEVNDSMPTEVAVVNDTITTFEPQETGVKELPSIVATLPVAPSSKSSKSAVIDSCCVRPGYYEVDADEESDHPPDSVEVLVPITQKVYEDSTYRAYVSGFNAKLDSISIYRRTEYITSNIIVKSKPKRFSIGVQTGYGITPKGFQPYIGIGVTYNLINL